MKKHKLYEGFTIIEIVLVLTIAGLIFLAVFLALPALQRSQRDAQRKRDIAAIGAAFIEYLHSNKGKMPKTETNGYDITHEDNNYIGFLTGYWTPSNVFNHISYENYNNSYTEAVWIYYDTVLVHFGGSCVKSDKGNWITPEYDSANPLKRRIAVYAILESEKSIKSTYSANVGANYCQDVGS